VAEYGPLGERIRSCYYGPNDAAPCALREGGHIYIVHHGDLNIPQGISDEVGNVVWSARYTAFGTVAVDVGVLVNHFRFPGQYYDAETGLAYNRARFYDAATGTYLSPDPLGYAGSRHLYMYAENNPVTKVDPTGLKVEVCTRPLAFLWGFGWFKHCDVKITTKNTWAGFFNTKSGWSGRGEVRWKPKNLGANCVAAVGAGNEIDCWDKCVVDAIAASKARNDGGRWTLGHNGCHWARDIVHQCSMKFPTPGINWPWNPGP